MKILLIALVLLLAGCKTIEPPPEPPPEPANPFMVGNVQCYEHTREDGYKGCCCDGEFDRAILDQIHRCGH